MDRARVPCLVTWKACRLQSTSGRAGCGPHLRRRAEHAEHDGRHDGEAQRARHDGQQAAGVVQHARPQAQQREEEARGAPAEGGARLGGARAGLREPTGSLFGALKDAAARPSRTHTLSLPAQHALGRVRPSPPCGATPHPSPPDAEEHLCALEQRGATRQGVAALQLVLHELNVGLHTGLGAGRREKEGGAQAWV